MCPERITSSALVSNATRAGIAREIRWHDMRRLAVTTLLLAAAATVASANGRPPGTSTINFRQGHPSDVIAGMTFGAVISHDSGATWRWFCEDAVGYGGMYDPDYAYSSSGKIFATTFTGLRVNADGCVFDTTPEQMKFVSSDELGPDGALYVGMADPTDSDIYKSTDDGVTFATMTMPGMINDWWQSIKIAPSDAQRIYLTGYRFAQSPVPDGGTVKVFLLFTSTTGGTSWTPMQMDTIMADQNSAIEIAGISKTDPTIVYARVTIANGTVGDTIYRSNNAGQTWTQILAKGDSLNAFLVRNNGDLVAGTPTLGASVSHDSGATWLPLTNPPHMNCINENAAGEVWACTQNYGTTQVPGDDAGIMKSTDLVTWSKVLRYQDIQAPVTCPAGTVQKDKCEAVNWCLLKSQLGITSAAINCASNVADLSGEAGSTDVTPPKKGCCDTGQGAAPGALVLGLVIGIIVLRPRKRRMLS